MREKSIKVFSCPKCGKQLSIDAEKSFRRGLCPNCRERITIPATPK